MNVPNLVPKAFLSLAGVNSEGQKEGTLDRNPGRYFFLRAILKKRPLRCGGKKSDAKGVGTRFEMRLSDLSKKREKN